MRRLARPPAAVLVLVAVLLTAACGGGGDDDGAASTTSPTASTATSAPTGGGGEGEADGEAGAPGAAPSATPPPAGGAVTEPAGAASGQTASASEGAAAPAAPGRYTYDVDGSVTFSGPTGQTQPVPPEARLTIDPPDGQRQRAVREATDGDGNGTISETVLVYAADGVHLESLKLTTRVGTFSDVREFRPAEPPLLVPASPKAGDTADFWMQTTDRRITAHVTVTVVGDERVAVAGTPVDALVIDTASTFSGDFEGKTASRGWIDRGRSLTVKEHSESDVRVGVNEAHSEYDAVLRSLTPS
jgi:hypothetical protein